jgi:hypothetical protein
MAAKKGQIPAHVKKKSFTHPGLEHPLIQAIERVEDERKTSQFFRYSLTSVIFMVFVLNYLCLVNYAFLSKLK